MSDSEQEHEIAQIEKNKKKRKFIHKYQSAWEADERFKLWIKVSKKGPTHFFCRYCSNDYVCGKAEILKHMNTKKHEKFMKDSKTCQRIDTLTSSSPAFQDQKRAKENEIRIASFLIEHNISFNTADHLVFLIKHLHTDKNSMNMTSCGRTKATKIITNVTGSYGKETILSILRTTKFSLIIDESTDIGTIKNLAVIARYYTKGKVCDTFLELMEISQGTAENIYNSIVSFFNENHIDYKSNMIGLAADGASVMMGRHHSVSVLFKNDIPHLFVLKCVCHSFALCASNAVKCLPAEIEQLTRDVFNFMRSFKRITEYGEFQKFVEVKPHKLLHPSQTRWLSLVQVVKRFLQQYDALSLYFKSEFLEKKNRTVESIYNLLNCKVTKLYFEFLSYALTLFTDLNIEFQSEAPKVQTLYNKIKQVYITLLDNYLKPTYIKNTPTENIQFRNPHNFLPLPEIYLGPYVSRSLVNTKIAENDLNVFRQKCLEFYIEAAKQIYQRFPFQDQTAAILKEISLLDPKIIRERKINSIATLAQHFTHFLEDGNISEIDRQWRLLRNEDIIHNEINDIIEFWENIKTVLNPDGTQRYSEITKLVEICLSLPHSSATCERLFSIINLNKTKIRNKLNTSTLRGILYAKTIIGDKKCYDYVITPEHLAKHDKIY